MVASFAMYVNLKEALINPASRVLIQPGDTLILRYTAAEEIANVALSVVNINFLFNGFNQF